MNPIYYIILQAITNGAVSADYTLVILVGLVGFLIILLGGIISRYVINNLNAITKRIEHNEIRLTEIEKRNLKIDAITEYKQRLEHG